MTELEFAIAGEKLNAEVDSQEESTLVRVGGQDYVFCPIGDNIFRVQGQGKVRTVAAVRHQGIFYIDIDGVVIEVSEADGSQFNGAATVHAAEKDKVYAPMPGKIVKLLVKENDTVTEKQPLLVVEAMKMENQVNSPANGRVKSVNFNAGDQVDTLSPIIELEIAD